MGASASCGTLCRALDEVQSFSGETGQANTPALWWCSLTTPLRKPKIHSPLSSVAYLLAKGKIRSQPPSLSSTVVHFCMKTWTCCSQ